MKILVVVAQQSEVQPMKRLLQQAGVQAGVFALFNNLDDKPSMKQLREIKGGADAYLRGYKPDMIVAAGETVARLLLDTSAVNINKLRGRDFEYVYGVKKPAKKGQG